MTPRTTSSIEGDLFQAQIFFHPDRRSAYTTKCRLLLLNRSSVASSKTHEDRGFDAIDSFRCLVTYLALGAWIPVIVVVAADPKLSVLTGKNRLRNTYRVSGNRRQQPLIPVVSGGLGLDGCPIHLPRCCRSRTCWRRELGWLTGPELYLGFCFTFFIGRGCSLTWARDNASGMAWDFPSSIWGWTCKVTDFL